MKTRIRDTNEQEWSKDVTWTGSQSFACKEGHLHIQWRCFDQGGKPLQMAMELSADELRLMLEHGGADLLIASGDAVIVVAPSHGDENGTAH